MAQMKVEDIRAMTDDPSDGEGPGSTVDTRTVIIH